MKFRRALVEWFAVLMGQEIEFPEDRRRIEADYQLKLAEDGYRIVREVRQNGTVHWFIEEYFTSLRKMEFRIKRTIYPPPLGGLYTDKISHWGRHPYTDKISHWGRHPKEYSSMEEAIDGLNNKIRKDEVSETTYIAVSDA